MVFRKPVGPELRRQVPVKNWTRWQDWTAVVAGAGAGAVAAVVLVDRKHHGFSFADGLLGCRDRRQRSGELGIPGHAVGGNSPSRSWRRFGPRTLVGCLHRPDGGCMDFVDRGRRGGHSLGVGSQAQHRRPPACSAVTLTVPAFQQGGAPRVPPPYRWTGRFRAMSGSGCWRR